METVVYSYKPKAWRKALYVSLCAMGIMLFGVRAARNDRGLLLNNVIELGPFGATIFYWVMTAMAVLATIFAILDFLSVLDAPQEIMLDGQAITIHNGSPAQQSESVLFVAITNLEIMGTRSSKILMIHHRRGKLMIDQSMLPRRADFKTLLEALRDRCAAAQRH